METDKPTDRDEIDETIRYFRERHKVLCDRLDRCDDQKLSESIRKDVRGIERTLIDFCAGVGA